MRGSCFSTSHEQALHTSGSWRPTASPPPYRIDASFWEAIGTSIKPSTPQHYGRCDDVEPNRTHYEWSPDGCTLPRFDVERACKALAGTSVLFVGDSTVFQLFLSFALLLRSRFGRSAKRASTVTEMTASAFEDATRLAFARSDLLLWSSVPSDLNSVRRCDGYTTLQPFAQRAARDADVVILGLGHHIKDRSTRHCCRAEQSGLPMAESSLPLRRRTLRSRASLRPTASPRKWRSMGSSRTTSTTR